MAERSRWDQVAQLLSDVGSIAPAEREAFLRTKTADADLRAEVLSLLGVEMPSGDVLERGALDWYRPEIASTEPSDTAPRLLVGELLAGRFCVETFLGRGGMGEVYAAEDRELHERVALKLLHPELASQPDFLDRFRREIRLARRISHPNVARVFDLVQEPGHRLGALHFYVLELLDGETLGARLKREGPLQEKAAIEIAKQMAAGLAAVHAAGILHRDFKPANVILTAGRAVVTDFGLAAPIVRETGSAALQTTSLLLGTPGYVAPEQWAGKAATVETDVYSFGIVLHEMVTGRHPNAEGPKLEGDWGKVVTKCLEMEPANRWSGPVEAVEALEPGWISRRNLLLGAVATVIATGGGYGVKWMLGPAMPKPGAKLLVAEIHNSTGDARFDAVGTALRMHLEQSTFFNIVQAADLAQALSKMLVDTKQAAKPEQFREAGWRLSAAAVVFGSFGMIGASPNLTLQVEWRGKQPQEPSGRETKSFAARGWGDVSQTVREAGNWVRSSVGDASLASAIYDRMPEQVTTPSWEALLHFTRAQEHAYQQRHSEALMELESALRLDAGFSFAAMRKADILNSMGRDLDSMHAWVQAILLLKARPTSRREELLTLGMYAFDSHNFKESEDQFARMSYEYPNDARGYFYRSTQMMIDGRARELVPVLRKAAELDSGLFSTYTTLGQVAVLLQDSSMFETAMTRLRELGKMQYVHLGETSRAWFDGNLTAVFDHCRSMQAMEQPRFRCEGRIQEANVYAEAGLFQKASAIYEEAARGLKETSTANVRARALIGSGYCHIAIGNAEKIPALTDGILEVQNSVAGLEHAAVLLARAGHTAKALNCIKRLEACPDVHKTRIALDTAGLEIDRSTGNGSGVRARRERLSPMLPRYGSQVWPSHDGDAAVGENPEVVAMAPLFFWLHTHHYRAGEWGRVIREMRTDSSGQPPLRQQWQVFRAALDALPKQQNG